MRDGPGRVTLKQYVERSLARIREFGVLRFFVRVSLRFLRIIINNLSGILAYPICFITNVRFVPFYVRSIGHLCVEVDCYIKEGILGMRPKYRTIVLAPHGTVANAHLLNYWKKFDLKVIDSPVLCFLLGPLSKNRFSGYNVAKYVFDYNPPFPVIQRKYYGRKLPLELSEFDYNRGWKLLENIGIPRGSWFVCVHCREDSYLGDVDQVNRSCNIYNYLLAMEAIASRGGWVIRMGDSKMKTIPRKERFIDYAHLDIKYDWMDIFLAASCKFFLGSNSGLCHVPTLFGVPAAIANYMPMSTILSYGADDVGISKLVWSKEKERYLTFQEVFDSPISNYRLDSSFLKANVKLVENSPEDIKDLAMELLDRTEGKGSYTKEDEVLQMRFKSLMRPGHYSYGAISRVGRDFLRKYKYLLIGDSKSINE